MSAYQYVLTAYRQGNSRPIPQEYVKEVISDVLVFRNTVAAHFAWAKHHSQNNEAERTASVMPPLGFVDDSFHAGVFRVTLKKAGKTSSSKAIRLWSISKTHDTLRKRYWPEDR